MSKNNVSDLLKKKAEKREQVQDEVGVAVEVEGETPERAAKVGEIVVLTWGDPQTIGGSTIEIPLIVTLADPQTEIGRAHV